MRYLIFSYGCQMNVADSQEMAQPLKERGFLATSRLRDADIVLMNTCTVRDQAEHRADSNIGRLRVWKKEDPNRILIVAGCAASRWGESIRQKYPFIDLVSPATQIENFPEAVARVLRERWDGRSETAQTFQAVGAAGRPPELSIPSDPNRNVCEVRDERPGRPAGRPYRSEELPGNPFGDENTAYVTIMRGCNYTCSYCIVPQVRGRETYRPMPQILDEVRRQVSEGKTEIMLLGQTVNSYHWRETGTPLDFADLLRAVNAVEGVELIRFMSPHPRHMRERVIQAMAECKKVARHIHLPVQSGSDRLLAHMKRLYTRDEYVAIVRALRAAIPGIQVTTDFIVGYPGETEQDMADSLSLMRELRFDGLFAFKYSPRPGTASAEAADDVPAEEKEVRLQRILELNRQIVAERIAWAS